MNIGIDITPLLDNRLLSHRVRGTGFYLQNLKKSLLKFYPKNVYTFFNKGDNLSKDIDVVHYPYFEPFFLTLPIIKRYKTVVTVHDLTPLVFPKYFPSGVKGSIKWQIQKFLLQNTNAIITDSESSKKDILRYTGVSYEKIHVIYLAAGEEYKKYKISNIKYQILRKKYKLPEKFVLYVGDVTWNKNLPRLIEAVKMVNIPLVMVGKSLIEKDFDKNNPWNKDLVKVQEMVKDNKNIFCLGFVPIEDLVTIYNTARVFIMPSLYEGFGLPVLEAMSCGCPVITTKEGSLKEIAGDAAFYVNSYDEKDIAQGLKKVFEDDKIIKDLSEKGLIQARKFSWEKTADNTVKVYEKFFNGK